MQLLAWYLGDRYYGIRHDNKQSIVTACIEKTIGDLKLGFTANDIFNGTVAEGNYNVRKTEAYYHRCFDNRYIKLTATYGPGGNEVLRRPKSKWSRRIARN